MFKIDTYLTEKHLGDILKVWAGEDNVVSQPFVPGTRMRYDYEVKRKGRVICVEFDGDSHYRDPNVIFRDWTKDKISAELNKEVVRIPYFIQLTTETFQSYFGEVFEIESSFPHGFITTKMLPASFCPAGYARALREMDELPQEVRTSVMQSLADKAEKLGDVLTYYRTTVFLGEDFEEVPWREFVRRSNEVHQNKYEYIHPL